MKPPRDLSLTSKGLLVIAIPLVALLAVALVYRGLLDSRHRAQALVAQTVEIRRQMQVLLTLAVDAETGVRGYALTGRTEFLEPFDAARGRLPIERARLQRLVAPNDAQAERVRLLERLLAQRLETLSRMKESVDALGPVFPGQRDEILEEGRDRMDRLRALLAEMQGEEQRLQDVRLAALVRSEDQLRLVGRLGVAAGVGGGLLASVAFARGIGSRVRELQRNAALLAEGAPLRELPPGDDEIGQLGRSMQAAADLLRQRDQKVAAVEEELRNGVSLLRATLDATTDGIAAIDTTGRLVVSNARFLEIWGVTGPEARGPGDAAFFAPLVAQLRDTESTLAAFRPLVARPDASGSQLVELKDGRVLDVRFQPQRQGEDIIGRVWSVRDVTEARRYERALEQARNEAEEARRVAEHAREEAELARDEADAANQAKSDFLSRMSHELRTPLNAVLGFGQLLEMDARDDRQRDSVRHILKGGRHLLDLINEVLDIARIESGRLSLSLEDIELREVVAEVFDLVAPMATTASVVLDPLPTVDASGWVVRADRQRLKQVLLNLVANAVKYNRPGGHVAIAVTTGQDRVRVDVTDTGMGIPPDALERLFTPFERLGAEQGAIEGTGLGLALSKRLVEAMGGAIGVESRLGEGSTFWIELAAPNGGSVRTAGAGDAGGDSSEHSPPDDVASVLHAAQTTKTKLLYIEDNLSNVDLLEQVVELRPHVELVTAMQGGMGIELARHHRPALVLLDLHLPDMHGADVLTALRRDPVTAAIPVVILSADATPGQIRRLLGAGANDYLTKPFEIRRILELLDGTAGGG